MAQGIDSTKMASRPSHEAVEQEADATEAANTDQSRLDHIAMEAAKRSSSRIVANEENIPSSTVFSK